MGIPVLNSLDRAVKITEGGTGGTTAAEARANLGLGAMVGVMYLWPVSTVPNGFAICQAQLLSVSAYPDLFAVLGNSYGGDGVNTFALPSMRSTGLQHIIRATYDDVVVAPSVVNVPAAIHSLNGAGSVLYFAVQMLDPVTVTNGPPKLSVTIGANTYLLSQSAATSTSWEYEYVVQATDFGEVTAAIDLNGATLASAGVPVNLNSYYTPGTLLSMQSAETLMTPTADTNVITQIQQLSGSAAGMTPISNVAAITQTQQLVGTASTMTPTADTNAITIT
jgi:microcystin-dependent protein